MKQKDVSWKRKKYSSCFETPSLIGRSYLLWEEEGQHPKETEEEDKGKNWKINSLGPNVPEVHSILQSHESIHSLSFDLNLCELSLSLANQEFWLIYTVHHSCVFVWHNVFLDNCVNETRSEIKTLKWR